MNKDIKTGVISVHSVSDFLIDDIFNNGTDLDFEAFIEENGDSQDVIDLYEMDNPDILFGCIQGDDEKWDIDPDAKLSLKYNGNQQTIQVLKSEFIKTDCVLCSPCYPMQGDLDSNHGNITCYTLDSKDLDENVGDETKSGIIKIEVNNVK